MKTPQQIEQELDALLYMFADHVTDRGGMVDSKESVNFRDESQIIKDYIHKIREEDRKEILERLNEKFDDYYWAGDDYHGETIRGDIKELLNIINKIWKHF